MDSDSESYSDLEEITSGSTCKCSLSKGFIGIEQGNTCLNLLHYGYDCFGNGPNGTRSPSGCYRESELKDIKFGPCRHSKMNGWLHLTDQCNCGMIFIINDTFHSLKI